MAVRSSWKGNLQVGMVTFPVKAYSVTTEGRGIQLHQLHSECHSRIRLKKSCPLHGDVSDDEIISGYEHTKDQYVVIDLNDLRKLGPQSDKTVEIEQFVPMGVIDPIYVAGRILYLLPDGPDAQAPYAALRDAMIAEGVQAIAQVILANRDELVCLRTSGKLITMAMLHRADDVNVPESVQSELTEVAVPREESELARQLIQAYFQGSFDIHQYPDTYRERLMELIQSRIDGREVTSPPVMAEPQVISLREALKASLEQAATKCNNRKKS